MPVTESAKKALRRDQRRAVVNERIRLGYKKALKEARMKASEAAIKAAYSALDRAAKKKVIHKNKAARLKSKLMNLVNQQAKERQKEKQAKTDAKKS